MYVGLGTGLILLIPLIVLVSLRGKDAFLPDTAESFWRLSADRRLRRSPVVLGLGGGFAGMILGLPGLDWRAIGIATLVGVGLGLFRPLFRYRVAAFFVVALFVGAALFWTGWDTWGGTAFSWFMGVLFGFVYAALLWGRRQDPLTTEFTSHPELANES